MSALLTLTLLAATPADAAVGDEYGGLIVNVMNNTGLVCGRVATIIESIDSGWECSLEGTDAVITNPMLCRVTLDAACADVGAVDGDGDGVTPDGGDCDDADPAVYPGAEEVCDGADNNCNGFNDLDAVDAVTVYADADADTYGDPASQLRTCEPPPDYVADSTDCDDTDPDVHPMAGDSYGDGVDGDCDAMDCEAGAAAGGYVALCFDDYSWHQARAVCQGAGYTDLVSVSSASDQADLEDLLAAAGAWSDSTAWLGYADEVVEGSWGWSDGSATTYTNWASGEPNNLGDEDCAEMNYPYESGQWNDGPCYDYTAPAFFCE